MVQRHVPERTCVACRLRQPKRNMVRVVRDGQGAVSVDSTGKRSGRGAYLCKRRECWALAVRRNALSRELKATIGATDRSALEAFAATLPAEAAAAMEGGAAEGGST